MKKLLLGFIALIFTLTTYAQSWQWGKRAGSGWSLSFSAEEIPVDMATDKNGNSYLISSVYPNALLSIDTNYLSSYFVSNTTNILLHSYDCEGNFRWSKVIGTQSGANSKSVQTDTLGGVYLLAKIVTNGTPIHIDNDTSFIAGNKQLYVIKFDTIGNLQWFTSPLSDTISFLNAIENTNPIDMHVNKNGDITVFTEMPPGNNLNGALTITKPESFALKYNRFGTFIAATPIPFKIIGIKATYSQSCNATVAPNGNFIFTGYRFYIPQDTLIAGTDTINERAFIIVSSTSGQLLWHKEVKLYSPVLLPFSNSIFLSRAVTDNANNIYLSGSAQPNDTLDGFVFVNNSNPVGSAMPLIAKFSATGNMLWANLGSNNAIALSYGITYSNNKVATTGMYACSNLNFLGSSLNLSQQSNEGRDPFLAIFDAQTGALISLDSLSGPFGYDETGYVITSDSKNNFYVAGSFGSYLSVNGSTLQTAGDKDIFIAKYGVVDCDFSVPLAVNNLVNISDVTMYPNPATSVLQIKSLQFKIEQIRIYNLLGACVFQTTTQQAKTDLTINVSMLNQGIYFVEITDDHKKVLVKKIAIE